MSERPPKNPTIPGPPRPASVKAAAMTVAPTGAPASQPPPTPIVGLQAAPEGTRVPYFSSTVTTPDGGTNTIGYYQHGLTGFASLEEIAEAERLANERIRARKEEDQVRALAEAQANAKLQARRPINWVIVPLVILGSIASFILFAWMLIRPFLRP